MWSILKRAWRNTLAGLGISDFSWGRLLLWAFVSAAFVSLIWLLRGKDAAMTEFSDIAYYALVFVVIAVLPIFLWNLWLAPYSLLSDRLDELCKGGGLLVPTKRFSQPAGQLNVNHWDGTKTLKLGDAACLWVNVRPYDPIDDDRAAGKFAQLSSTMMRGDIPYQPVGLRALTSFLEGMRPWPEYSYPVSAIALRKFADKINDVPKFLQSVEVPPEPEPETETEIAEEVKE